MVEQAVPAEKTFQSHDLFFVSELPEVPNYCSKAVSAINSYMASFEDNLEKELLLLQSPVALGKTTSATEISCNESVSNKTSNVLINSNSNPINTFDAKNAYDSNWNNGFNPNCNNQFIPNHYNGFNSNMNYPCDSSNNIGPNSLGQLPVSNNSNYLFGQHSNNELGQLPYFAQPPVAVQTSMQQPDAQLAGAIQQQQAAALQQQTAVMQQQQAALQLPRQQTAVQMPPLPALRQPLAEKPKNNARNKVVKESVKRSQTQRSEKKNSKLKRTKSFKRVRKVFSSEESGNESQSPVKLFA